MFEFAGIDSGWLIVFGLVSVAYPLEWNEPCC